MDFKKVKVGMRFTLKTSYYKKAKKKGYTWVDSVYNKVITVYSIRLPGENFSDGNFGYKTDWVNFIKD
jgi:hypothetical protein